MPDLDDVHVAAGEVALCGWAVTSTPGEVVRAVLGSEAAGAALRLAAGEWRFGQHVDRTLPMGPVPSLVEVHSAADTTVQVAMGSQVLAEPPTSATPAWGVAVAAGQHAVVDSRCWFRVTDDEAVAVLWRPVAADLESHR
jgi:hypothetical protein